MNTNVRYLLDNPRYMFLLFNTLIVGYQNFLLCEKPRKRNNELKDMV